MVGAVERAARTWPQRPRIAARVQEIRIDLALHDGPPAALGRRRVDPRRQRHPGREVQRRTVGDQDEVAGAAEAQRIAVAPQRRPRRPRDRARVVTAGRIGDGGPGALVKTPRGDETSLRPRNCWRGDDEQQRADDDQRRANALQRITRLTPDTVSMVESQHANCGLNLHAFIGRHNDWSTAKVVSNLPQYSLLARAFLEPHSGEREVFVSAHPARVWHSCHCAWSRCLSARAAATARICCGPLLAVFIRRIRARLPTAGEEQRANAVECVPRVEW